MTDNLRTRIVAIIHRECGYEGENFCQHLAGVLVAELGLQREFSIGDDDGGRVLWYEGEEPVAPRDGEVVECRWISGWECDAVSDSRHDYQYPRDYTDRQLLESVWRRIDGLAIMLAGPIRSAHPTPDQEDPA